MTEIKCVGGQYRPLSEKQIQDIHSASLKILSQVGLTYDPGIESILKLIDKAGVTIDPETDGLIHAKYDIRL